MHDVDKYFKFDPQQRKYVAQSWRRSVIPFYLYPDFSSVNNAAITIAASGAQTAPVVYRQRYYSQEGADQGRGYPFEWKYLLFPFSETAANDEMTVVFTEIGEQRQLMNQPIHVRTIFGSARFPGVLQEPLFLFSNDFLQAQFNKLTGGAVSKRIYFGGAAFAPWSTFLMDNNPEKDELLKLIDKWRLRKKYVTPFYLTTQNTVSLSASAVGTATSKIGDDSHFEAMALSIYSDGELEFTVSEAKTRQTLMNGVITKNNAIGDGQFPTPFPIPYLLRSGTRLEYKFRNLTADTNRVFVTIHGRRIRAPFKDVRDVLQDTFTPGLILNPKNLMV